MKFLPYALLAILLFVFVGPTHAQITNLVVNSSSSNFTMTTGDTIHWEYNINPAGATVNAELWYDVNGNGTIEPATDKLRFAFTQTDGDASDNGGPPDMDGSANGHVIFSQHVGLAPGKYIFKMWYNADVHMVTGTCLALSSPVHTISGSVTPPAGKSAQYIFVQIRRNGNYEPNFWDAVTDASGNYSIGMNADTAGNPWGVRLADNYNPYPPSIVTPSEISLNISASSYTGMNFSFLTAVAQVAGYLKDENNNVVPNQGVSLNRYDGGVNRQTNTNASGFFQIGLLSGDLTGQSWILQTDCHCNNGVTGAVMYSEVQVPPILSGDSLSYTLRIYSTNDQIQGTVLVDGAPPGFPIQIIAQASDSGLAVTYSDGGTGDFTVNVSNKLYNYNLFGVNLPFNYQSPSVGAHPGQTGVALNITITSVREREPGIPGQFLLKQNYPNPFNPVTDIDYDVASTSHVQLVVYNLLGQEVARLVDKDQAPGKYKATFDGSRLGSGIYFYQIHAGTFSKTMKMILVK